MKKLEDKKINKNMLIQLVFHLKNLIQNGYCLRTDTLKEEYIIVYLAFCFSFSNNTYILDSVLTWFWRMKLLQGAKNLSNSAESERECFFNIKQVNICSIFPLYNPFLFIFSYLNLICLISCFVTISCYLAYSISKEE